MAKKFSNLRAKMSPESQAEAHAKANEMLAKMPLQELRLARGLSQSTLAEILHVKQPAIAKIEKRTDMYLSTLRNHIRAMGGDLEIVAKFSDGYIVIDRFQDSDNLDQEENKLKVEPFLSGS